ncbi:AEC family transporter [Salinarchaeum laminariae]|uniref:AEC family transporter n=1 Tax=Salinarchaeum laminariae TaxID=869888 RepID=UPI0020C0DE21|nr:AEC family transporter [Salinarchaeum laminariae]
MSLFDALTQAVLPVLAIASAGYALGWVRDVDVEPLAAISIYVLTPALVFHSLATTPIGGETAVRLGVGVTAFTLGMVAIATGVARITGHPDETRGAMVLASTFPNAGNYGIPLAAFAFGSVGRSTAILYIVFQAVLMYTIGVYIASRGTMASGREAVIEVFTLPLVYALAAAWLARALSVVPPADSAAMEAIQLTGNAAIPVMLLLLGIQLANTTYGAALRSAVAASLLKLFVAPVVALGVAMGLGLSTEVGRVFVLACAMPAAVTPLMLVVEYGEEQEGVTAPEFLSTAVLLTTLASVVTLTVLIALLQDGVLV